MDEIDKLIVEGLSGYVNVRNAALKHELAADPNKFILAGKLNQRPAQQSPFQVALSLGMTAMSEAGGETLAAPMPDSKINREIHSRLVQHFMGRTNHGLRTDLATMGLEGDEKKLFTSTSTKHDPKVQQLASIRAADRALEIITGRHKTSGYPITGEQNIVGGHEIGRKTSIINEQPEQITQRHNMNVEGELEGQVRHEHRGRKAADLTYKKLVNYLASDAINAATAERVIDTMVKIQNQRPGAQKLRR